MVSLLISWHKHAPCRSLLFGAWDYDEFREKHLPSFLQMMDDWEHSGAFPEDAPEEIG